MNAAEVYAGSDGDLTRQFYERLQTFGPIGFIAVNLFRASKASARAKVYRGKPGRGQPSYRRLAYDRKSWAMDNLCQALQKHADPLGIGWGWKPDPSVPFGDESSWVLYVDLPTGRLDRSRLDSAINLDRELIVLEEMLQNDRCLPVSQISFHSPTRGKGPGYPGDWDRTHQSAERIVSFCDAILGTERKLAL